MNHQVKQISQWLGTGSINIFGRPFSGKDTQCRLLADLLDGTVISGGDILRSHHDPKKIEEVLSEGGLVPSGFYLNLVLPYLSQSKFKKKSLILSAVGHSSGEESITMKAAADSGHPIKAVVLLDISDAEAWRRFEAAKIHHDRGKRSDDSRGVLKTRLEKFQQKTMPVIEFYRQHGLLLEVDGSLSRQAVAKEILEKLAERANSAN